jgi:hypothetical protein
LIDFSESTAKCCLRWSLTGGSAFVDRELMAFAYHDPTPDRVLRATGQEWCSPDSFDCSYYNEKTRLPTRKGVTDAKQARELIDEQKFFGNQYLA